MALLDELDGDLHVEKQVTLPLDVDGERVTISGIVDLVHETANTVSIIDYKTDSSRHAQPEYRTQLSVYYHVLTAWFEDKPVTASFYYTADGDRVSIDPRPRADLRDIVREQTDEFDGV